MKRRCSAPPAALPRKDVLDNAIAAGEIAPLIVVCPTYNNTSPDDSASFSLALTLTENYHRELLNDLIPAVESQYSTYADDASPAVPHFNRSSRCVPCIGRRDPVDVGRSFAGCGGLRRHGH